MRHLALRPPAFLAFAFVLVLALAAAPATAQEPESITVNVVRENAEAVIVVNGVPIHHATWDAADAGTPVTDAVNIGLWLVDGTNAIAVEATAKGEGGYVEVKVLKSFDEPYLLEQRIDGDGRVETSVVVAGQPRWGWLDAEPWTGDASELLAAVAALHDAVARRDVAAFLAAHQARNDDYTIVFGPMPPEMAAEFEKMLATVSLEPLSASLAATPYADGRLWRVNDEAGQPPIRMFDPGMRLETGEFWIRRDGTWQIIR
ncbi:MAG: hypothetical protein ACREER_00560 [Alphaproteobacteria bacterium]